MKTVGEPVDQSTFTGDNPFPGLRPFEDDEAYLFFGREQQIDELLRRLRTERFIAVVGTSGSGKSSLIRAGLFSALRVGAMSGAGSRWRIATMRPGNDPIGQLAAQLESAGLLGTEGDADLRTDLAYAILERGALGLVEIVRQMPIREDENVLIVVDQFEELFRYAQSEEDTAAAFVRLLLEATSHPDLRLYVVLTMRSDFLGDCASFTNLPERINRGLYLVPRMTRDHLEAAIVGPVRVAGTQIAPQLVNRLLNDVGDDPDQLPVLAHALMLTYDLWTADHASGEPIDERHYSATGGLAQAIDAHAERIFAELTPTQQTVAEKLFAAITELGPDNRGIRRPLAFEEVCAVCDADEADVRAVVEAYRARTCSFLRPPPEVPVTGHTVIDIGHEALMRGWSRLRRLLNEEVESARTYERLSDAAQMHARAQGALLVDPALALNLEWRDRFAPTAAWAKRYGGDFPAAMGFIELSAQEKARQRAARVAQSRRRWTVAGVVMALMLLLTFASIASFVNAQHERSQALIAQSQFLARDANAQTEKGDAVSGMLIAREALPLSLGRPDRPFVQAAALALENGLNNNRELRDIPTGGRPVNISLSRDGRRIALQMSDDTARVFDVASGKLVLTLRGHAGPLYYVAYSPNGKRLVTASADRTARIWDAATGRTLRILRGHGNIITNAVFSPDGRFILTTSDDKTARIWRADDGTLVRILHMPAGVSDGEYSPDGTRIVLSPDFTGPVGTGRVARVFDAATGALLLQLRGHTDFLISGFFSHDGTRIATSGGDHTTIIWDARSGRALHVLTGDTATVIMSSFSPDNKSLVTASSDGTARIWDLASGANLAILRHGGPVNCAIYSHDGSTILTTSADGMVHLWRASPSLLQHVLPIGAPAGDIEYSPDGLRIVTASQDGIARIWNAQTGTLLSMLHAEAKASAQFSPDGKQMLIPAFHGPLRIWDLRTARPVASIPIKGIVRDAEYSPDGTVIAAGSDNVVRLFDVKTGSALRVLRGHEDTVSAIAFSPNGSHVAAGANDNTVRVWSVASGKTTAVLRGHNNIIIGVHFSADGKRIVTGSVDGTIRIWDAANGTSLLTIRPDVGAIGGAAFSPDGSEVAAAAYDDRTVRLFDASTGAPLAVLRGATGKVFWVVFSPDGKAVAATSDDRNARTWSAPPRLHCQALFDAAQRAIPRELTDTQRQEEYLSDRAPAPLFNTFASAGTCR
jgi:WD40 repeat protein